eukprot:evm.model.scf_2352.1 EVM.evm.TU.scf_2352.1   scf_2352:18035-21805(-)
MTMDGCEPLFNEQVCMDFAPKGGDFSPAALQSMGDLITINVFDETERKGPQALDESQGGSPGARKRHEKAFLGSLRLPVSTVYQLRRVEGTFELDSPAVVLGHAFGGGAPVISVFITLKPELQRPGSAAETNGVGEQEDIVRNANRWQAGVSGWPGCSQRRISCMALDTDGTHSLLTRFLAPTRLPPELERLMASNLSHGYLMRKAARFVSLVPFMDDSIFSKRQHDVWTTSTEFLYITAGDHEEHAVLLAGYFAEIGQKAWVVLGATTLGARSAFVLTNGHPRRPNATGPFPERGSEPNVQVAAKWRLWNPINGRCFSLKDVKCELREVGVVFDDTNIWANIQRTAEPWTMSWDLCDPKMWRPFFGAHFPHRHLATLQGPPLYEELNEIFYEELEARVEDTIRDTLYDARKRLLSQPHKRLSRVLKRLLRDMPEDMAQIMQAEAE